MSTLAPNLRSDTRPLYVRAVDALYGLIERGVYAPGQMLPAEAEFAKRLGVSRSTIREAMGHLEKDGLIIRKQGLGTFVAPRSTQISGGLERLASFRSVAEAAGAAVQTVMRSVNIIRADARAASVLEVEPGSELVQVQVVESIAGCQMAYLEGVIRANLVDYQRLAAGQGSLLEYLSEHRSLPIAYSRSAIYAVEADAALAGRLGVAEGKAILHLAETVYTDADAPIAHFRNYFITDCYHLKIVRRISRATGLIDRAAPEDSQHGTI